MKTKIDLESILDNFIEVKLEPSKFLVIRETLQRIGVSPKSKNVLYQSCHILSMNNKYYIVHFKELFLLDGKESSLDELDKQRRNQIAKLLQDWGLLEICHPERFPVLDFFMKMIKIVSAKDKLEWKLVTKYHLGNKNSRSRSYNSDDYWENHT